MKHLFTLLSIFILSVQIQAQDTLINETFETGWTDDSNVIPTENEEGTPAADGKVATQKLIKE